MIKDEVSMDDDKDNHKHSIISPENIKLLVPILVAFGGGFLMHDRAISKLQAESAQYATQINETKSNITTDTASRESIQIILDRVNSIEAAQLELQRTNASTLKMVENVSVEARDNIKEVREWLRSVEREIGNKK